jgi:hypothetical protein
MISQSPLLVERVMESCVRRRSHEESIHIVPADTYTLQRLPHPQQIDPKSILILLGPGEDG